MHADKSRFEYAGASGGWIDYLGYPFARGRIFDYCEEDSGQYNSVSPIFWASGAALFIRANLYHAVNGLDEYFFAHQEEIDLCWRLQLAGYTIMSCPAAVVYHVGGGTLQKGNSRKTYLNFRNNLIMLAKNDVMRQLWWKLPLRFMLNTIIAWKSLFSGGQRGDFIAVAKAHLAFVYWGVFRRSASPYPVSKNGMVQGWYKGSIVWDYFIKRKTKFSQIIDENAF
jgi:hypothetical protein